MKINGLCVRFSIPMWKLISGFLTAALLAGCATPPTAMALIPATGSAVAGGRFHIEEYPLVEQSIDNPTHTGFQLHVPDSVRARREGLALFKPEDVIQVPNQALEAFGYRLAPNPTPPFGAYALYQGDTLIQADIARFWPVSLKKATGSASDFVLAYETLYGERQMASLAGVQPWPSQGQANTASSPPVYLKGDLAYASLNDSGVNVMAGSELLYAGAPGTPRNLYTWGEDHWALELDGQVIVDGEDLGNQRGYQEIFHWSLVDQQPFYFFIKNGLTHLNYAGRDLTNTYDLVVHDGQGDAALFNPVATERIVWFYALRDGLWYYVEGWAGE